MKKLFFFLTAIFVLSSSISPKIAFAENLYYAKVQSTGVQMYGFPNETSVMFEIPYSFFVLVGQGTGNYYKATYNGVTGYVKKDKVSLMDGTPKEPYFKSNFNVVFPTLYTEANSNSEVISNSLSRSTNLSYFGKKIGEFLTEESGTWYYVGAELDGEMQYGYVYSVFAYSNPTKNIYTNDETFDIVQESLFASTNQFQSLSVGTKILLVFAIAIPSVLILYFLIKPSKIMQLSKSREQRLASKKHKKKVQHGDYFEFDEADL